MHLTGRLRLIRPEVVHFNQPLTPAGKNAVGCANVTEAFTRDVAGMEGQFTGLERLCGLGKAGRKGFAPVGLENDAPERACRRRDGVSSLRKVFSPQRPVARRLVVKTDPGDSDIRSEEASIGHRPFFTRSAEARRHETCCRA
jgi:hypothetical protein